MANELVEDIQCGLFGPCNAANLRLCWLTRVMLISLSWSMQVSGGDRLTVYHGTNICRLDLQWLWSVCSLGPLVLKFKGKHIMGTHGAHFKFT